MEKVPVGFRFEPTDQELVYYLRRKVKGETLPTLLHDLFRECTIYGDKEPWKIFDKNSQETFYVFTKLKKKSNSRIERIAGCGAWDGRQTKPVEDHSEKLIGSAQQKKVKPIGFDKYFVFEVEKDLTTDTEINGHWTMHEFSLAGEEFNDNVVCVIRNKDAKKNLEGDQSNNTDEQIRATHARKQGNGSRRSKNRNLNPDPKNQKQKKMRNTSTMDNTDVQEKKKIGDPCLLQSNPISEPIKNLEPESSLNLANQFKEEDIMAPYTPQPMITKPDTFEYVYMESTSSPYFNFTAYDFGKDLMFPFFLQPSLNVEPIPTKEWTPMMKGFDPKNGDEDVHSYWDQPPKQVSENKLPNTKIGGATVPVNTNFQN